MTAYTFPLLDNSAKNNFLLDNNIAKSPNYLIEKVSRYMHVTISDMKSQCRKRDFVEARQIAMYLIRKHTRTSQKETAWMFGKRDHTTVIYAIKTVNNLNETNREFRERFQGIMSII